MTVKPERVSKPNPAPRQPKALPPDRSPATPLQLWYLDCLRLLTIHLGRPPKITELSLYCKKTVYPCYDACMRLEAKGILKRNADRRFEIVRVP